MKKTYLGQLILAALVCATSSQAVQAQSATNMASSFAGIAQSSCGSYVEGVMKGLFGDGVSQAQIDAELAKLNGSLDSHGWVGSLMEDNRFQAYLPVSRLYWALFNRVPDVGGLDYWKDKINSGWSLYDVAESFSHSGEYTAVYGGLSNEDFINKAYLTVLGREADSAGYKYYEEELLNGLGRTVMLVNFAESAENVTKHQSRDKLGVLYNLLVQQTPPQQQLIDWTAQVDAGSALKVAIDKITNISGHNAFECPLALAGNPVVDADGDGDFKLEWAQKSFTHHYKIVETSNIGSPMITKYARSRAETDPSAVPSHEDRRFSGHTVTFNVIGKKAGKYSYAISKCLSDNTCGAPNTFEIEVPFTYSQTHKSASRNSASKAPVRIVTNSPNCALGTFEEGQGISKWEGELRTHCYAYDSDTNMIKAHEIGYDYSTLDSYSAAKSLDELPLPLDYSSRLQALFNTFQQSDTEKSLTIDLLKDKTYCINKPISTGDLSGKSFTINGNGATFRQCEVFVQEPQNSAVSTDVFESNYLLAPLLHVKNADDVKINELNGRFGPSAQNNDDWFNNNFGFTAFLAQWLAAEAFDKTRGTCAADNNPDEITNLQRMRYRECRDDAFIYLQNVKNAGIFDVNIDNFVKGVVLKNHGSYDIENVTFNGFMDELSDVFGIKDSYSFFDENGVFVSAPTPVNNLIISEFDGETGYKSHATLSSSRMMALNPAIVPLKNEAKEIELTFDYYDVVEDTVKSLYDKKCPPFYSTKSVGGFYTSGTYQYNTTRCSLSGNAMPALWLIGSRTSTTDTTCDYPTEYVGAPGNCLRRITKLEASNSGAAIVAGNDHRAVYASDISCNKDAQGRNWDNCIYFASSPFSKVTDVLANNVMGVGIKLRGVDSRALGLTGNTMRAAVNFAAGTTKSCDDPSRASNLKGIFAGDINVDQARGIGIVVEGGVGADRYDFGIDVTDIPTAGNAIVTNLQQNIRLNGEPEGLCDFSFTVQNSDRSKLNWAE